MDESRERRFPWGKTVAALVCLVVLTAILLPAVTAARRAARRSQRRNDLMQIGLALHNFHDVYKRFPSAARCDDLGRPLSSWRLQIIYFMEGIMIEVDLAERWDEPGNRWVLPRLSRMFCWSEFAFDGATNWDTSVVAITGPGTALDASRVNTLADMDRDTVLAIEVADSGIAWTEPLDLDIRAVPPSIVRGPEGDGVHVLFADGSVWFLDAAVPLEKLTMFFTIAGAKQYDRESVLGPYASK